MIISTDQVSKTYRLGSSSVKAVRDVTMQIKEGDFIVIVGPSGSGKSTLLQLIGGLDRPSSGSVKVHGRDLAKTSDRDLTRLRRETIGFIFQNFNLIPTLTARENVEAAIAHRTRHDRTRVEEIIENVGLKGRADHLPSRLSGGEQQRVAIARALINKPALILADEPTGNLDSRTGEDILNILKDLNVKQHKTVVVITHNEYAEKFASHVLIMKDGALHRQS